MSYSTRKNPWRWIKSGTKALLLLWFRVKITGDYQPPANALIIANRTSILDALLLAVFLPQRLTIVTSSQMFHWLGLKALQWFAEVLVVDHNNPYAARTVIKAIKAGKRCLIFPQEAYSSAAFIIQKTAVEVIPVRIDGAQNSIFAINRAKHRIRWFPKIRLHVMPARAFFSVEATNGRESIRVRLFSLMTELVFANYFQPRSLFASLIEGVYLGIKNKAKIEDNSRNALSYRQFIVRCFILGRQIKQQTAMGEYVGLMMPTTTAGMITFFALQAYRRIPAMLNFSAGFYNLFSACSTAGIKTIYTSSQFITTAKLEPLIDELRQAGISIRFLEEFKSSIHWGHKISALIKGMFPAWAYKNIGQPVNPDQTGLILFTSGSEGLPKGVALSHSNVLANCYQMMSRVDFTQNDVFFNALPIFHCFGLTAGSLTPLISGINCFFYPSPLHYKIIPGLVSQTQATIMFGTDTFLTGYARVAQPQDFKTVRYIFAGAEKVKPETIKYWQETFAVTVYEGYGATEASPVISLNCPLASLQGSVGMILPFMESRIEPVEGIEHGGRLALRGPNVMKGYLCAASAGSFNAPNDGWHDTGDIVTIDSAGFITIIGRAKRFAKIAGEMISLTAVEGIAASLWPELLHAAVAQKCPRKGEHILLFSEAAHADKSSFIKKVHEQGYSELLVPQHIYQGNKIPILPSGKIDYCALEKALELE